MTIQYLPRSMQNHAHLGIRQTIARWRCLSQAQISRIANNERGDMKQLQARDADMELAQARIEHLEPIAQSCWSHGMKQSVELGTVLIGALTFSTIPHLLATSTGRSSFALSIGLLGGGVAAWLTHDRATRALGRFRCQHEAHQALASLKQQHHTYPNQNELVSCFFEQQRTRLYQIEASSLQTQFPVDLALALFASGLECAAAYFLVRQVDTLRAFLISLFPVAIIWLAAVFQSEHVEFAEACSELVHDYYPFLPNDPVSEEEMLHVRVVDAAVNHFIAPNPTSIRTVKGSRANAKAVFAQERMDQIRADGIQTARDRHQHLCQEQAALVERMPQGMDWCSQERWQERETARLNRIYNDEWVLLQAQSTREIQRWQRIQAEAEQEFADAEANPSEPYSDVKTA
jgi:hypothetical protein